MRRVFTIPLAGLVAGIVGTFSECPRCGSQACRSRSRRSPAVSLPKLEGKRFEEVTGGGGGIVLPLPETPFGWDIWVTGSWLYYEAWVTAGMSSSWPGC